MHDPFIQVCVIHLPLPKRWFWTKEERERSKGAEYVHDPRPVLATVWHKDPERDGSDDSCGYSVPRLTQRQRERLENLAWSESRNPYFLRRSSRAWTGPRTEAEVMYRALILQVAQVLGYKMTFEEAARRASLEMHHADDGINPASRFVFEHGYHTNFPTPSEEYDQRLRQEHFHGILCQIAKWEILKPRRPWWRHPRWHVHHWRIQIRPLQKVWRWLFQRCSICKKRFGWNEDQRYTDWNGTRVWHYHCDTGSAVGSDRIDVTIEYADRNVPAPTQPPQDCVSPPKNPLPSEDP